MSKPKSKGRRQRVLGDNNHRVYLRYDGQYEYNYRDSGGQLRWPGPFSTVTEARQARNKMDTRLADGETVRPSPRLKFGETCRLMLDEQLGLVDNTSNGYDSYFRNHLKKRWGNKALKDIDARAAVKLIGDLRAAGYAESTIHGIVGVASRTFKYARRFLHWRGENPFDLLTSNERPKPSDAPERRLYTDDELEQVLAQATEPWRTMIELADMTGGRMSELLGLCWDDLYLDDVDRATISFRYQVTRKGARVKLKTEESKATLPLTREAVLLLLEHKARSTYTGPRAFVFSSRSGRAVGQRNVSRALYRCQERARTADGQPTFPELFERDARGHLVVGADGDFVRNDLDRKGLNLPAFHSLRHGAAMAAEDLEEARDICRHKSVIVTGKVYRNHFDDKRREALRGKLESRSRRRRPLETTLETKLETAERSSSLQAATEPSEKPVLAAV